MKYYKNLEIEMLLNVERFVHVDDKYIFKYALRVAHTQNEDAFIQGFVSGNSVFHSIRKIFSFLGGVGSFKNLQIFDKDNKLIGEHKGF